MQLIIDLGKYEQSKAESILQRLAPTPSEPQADESKLRREVVLKALRLLNEINTAFKDSQSKQQLTRPLNEQRLYEPGYLRVLNALLDLISLEGIRSFLIRGVGAPSERRVQPLLQSWATSRKPEVEQLVIQKDGHLLAIVVKQVSQVVLDSNGTLGGLVSDRILVDIISAYAQLAYGADHDKKGEAEEYEVDFKHLLDQYVSTKIMNSSSMQTLAIRSILKLRFHSSTSLSRLLPVLTSLLHPSAPSWLRPPILRVLSLLPLRPHGVIQVIEFVASSSSSNQEALDIQTPQQLHSKSHVYQGPDLQLDGLERAAHLLTSVPSSLTPKEYFLGISSQLFDMLDDNARPDTAKAAAIVMARILMAKKLSVTVGQAAWDVFVKPLAAKINPKFKLDDTGSDVADKILVSGQDLDIAVKRLAALIFSHSNPTLARRLLRPILLPLWGLLCFTRDAHLQSWHTRVASLLETYFKSCAGEDELLRVVDNLNFDGEPPNPNKAGWVFAADKSGRVEIRRRSAREREQGNLAIMNARVESRVDQFMDLVGAIGKEDNRTGALFLAITRRWLSGAGQGPVSSNRLDVPSDEGSKSDPFQMLINLLLVNKFIQDRKEELACNGGQMIELVRQLIGNYTMKLEERKKLKEGLKKPSIAKLAQIVDQSNEQLSDEEPVDTVSIALSLLTSVLMSELFQPSTKDREAMKSLQPLLSILSKSHDVPTSVLLATSHLASLLLLVSAQEPQHEASHSLSRQDKDRNTHSLALSYITEPLAPIRAEGLAMLRKLIEARSPVVDAPIAATMLISLLQDPDEFVYLNVIKTLTALASKHPKTVTRMLVADYIDQAAAFTMEQRLKIGEALLRVMQVLGQAFTGESAYTVADGCLALASRRGRRLERQSEKHTGDEDSEEGVEEDSTSPSDLPHIGEDQPDELSEAVARILSGWRGRAGEEDVRIRTSALSIFGATLETNIAGVGASRVSAGLDLAMAILSTERAEEKGILRRAAAVVIMSYLKALDGARSERRQLGFGLSGETSEKVMTLLRYVQSTDSDELVRDHAATVIESMAAWGSKTFHGALSAESPYELGVGISEGKLAGLSVNPVRSPGSGPRIEEIE